MLSFDEKDPFPLLPPGTHTYSEAQEHARLADAWLGLRTQAIEDEILERGSVEEGGLRRQQLWIGLPTKSLLTPYTEIRDMLWNLDPQPGNTIVDLGAGYGRLGFVLGHHYPGVKFIGYELVAERVRESRRCLEMKNHPHITMVEADLSAAEFKPAPADFYFIYDFGTRDAIEKSLQDLRTIAQLRPICVVGRGRSSRDAIEQDHPWLSQVISVEHHGHYSIYRSGVRA